MAINDRNIKVGASRLVNSTPERRVSKITGNVDNSASYAKIAKALGIGVQVAGDVAKERVQQDIASTYKETQIEALKIKDPTKRAQFITDKRQSITNDEDRGFFDDLLVSDSIPVKTWDKLQARTDARADIAKSKASLNNMTADSSPNDIQLQVAEFFEEGLAKASAISDTMKDAYLNAIAKDIDTIDNNIFDKHQEFQRQKRTDTITIDTNTRISDAEDNQIDDDGILLNSNSDINAFDKRKEIIESDLRLNAQDYMAIINDDIQNKKDSALGKDTLTIRSEALGRMYTIALNNGSPALFHEMINTETDGTSIMGSNLKGEATRLQAQLQTALVKKRNSLRVANNVNKAQAVKDTLVDTQAFYTSALTAIENEADPQAKSKLRADLSVQHGNNLDDLEHEKRKGMITNDEYLRRNNLLRITMTGTQEGRKSIAIESVEDEASKHIRYYEKSSKDLSHISQSFYADNQNNMSFDTQQKYKQLLIDKHTDVKMQDQLEMIRIKDIFDSNRQLQTAQKGNAFNALHDDDTIIALNKPRANEPKLNLMSQKEFEAKVVIEAETNIEKRESITNTVVLNEYDKAYGTILKQREDEVKAWQEISPFWQTNNVQKEDLVAKKLESEARATIDEKAKSDTRSKALKAQGDSLSLQVDEGGTDSDVNLSADELIMKNFGNSDIEDVNSARQVLNDPDKFMGGNLAQSDKPLTTTQKNRRMNQELDSMANVLTITMEDDVSAGRQKSLTDPILSNMEKFVFRDSDKRLSNPVIENRLSALEMATTRAYADVYDFELPNKRYNIFRKRTIPSKILSKLPATFRRDLVTYKQDVQELQDRVTKQKSNPTEE